jgi:hypothetical protein
MADSARGIGGAGCAVLFGLPFLATGVGVTWYAVHQHLAGARPEDAPWWILGGIGIVFGAAGLFVMAQGIASAVSAWRTERRMLAHPNEPWRGDFAWDRRYGHDTTTARGLLGGLVFLVVLCLFLAPFNWWAWHGREVPVILFVAFFDLLPIGVVIGYLGVVNHRLKYGRPRLALDRFPFFLGEELSARLVAPRALRNCQSVTVTLRQVDVAAQVHATSDPAQVARNRGAAYTDSVKHDRVRDVLEDGALPIRFALPADGNETWLGHTPPRHWEIEVHGEAPGQDFRRTFYVPVYRRRRATA